jgi:DNA repair exonuclease SbcCD ATPase subunit
MELSMKFFELLNSLNKECNEDHSALIEELTEEYLILLEGYQDSESKLVEDITSFDSDTHVFDWDEVIPGIFDNMDDKYLDWIERIIKSKRKIEIERQKNLTRARNLKKKLKKTLKNWKSLVARKGHATRKLESVIETLYLIYDKCDSDRFKNIDNLKKKIMTEVEGVIGVCPECGEFLPDCVCKKRK